jgi:hypothetical protein
VGDISGDRIISRFTVQNLKLKFHVHCQIGLLFLNARPVKIKLHSGLQPELYAFRKAQSALDLQHPLKNASTSSIMKLVPRNRDMFHYQYHQEDHLDYEDFSLDPNKN